MGESRARTSARMVMGFRRLRKSKHYMEIHSLIVAGVACTEIARKIQMEWKEMMDVTQESLGKQLTRYRDTLRVGGLAPHERYKRSGEGGEPQPEKEGAEPGAWAAGEMGGGQIPGGMPEGKLGVAKGGPSTSLAMVVNPLQQIAMEKMGKGIGVVVPGQKVGDEPILPSMFDVREELIDLYKVQIARILQEVEAEGEISKLLPGTGFEVNTAVQILKAIHVVNADLGMLNNPKGKGSVGNALGVDMGEELEECMGKSLIVRTISEKKSRKRILKALGAGASLVGGTNNGEKSENGPVEDGQVIENVTEKGEGDELKETIGDQDIVASDGDSSGGQGVPGQAGEGNAGKSGDESTVASHDANPPETEDR